MNNKVKLAVNITATISPEVLNDLIEEYLRREHSAYKVEEITYVVNSGNYNIRPSLRQVEVELVRR